MDYITKGWLLLAAGIIIRYIIARRMFNRRGLGGLQHYRSFEQGIINTFLEWVCKWAAILMIIVGILNLLVALNHQDKEGKATLEQSRHK